MPDHALRWVDDLGIEGNPHQQRLFIPVSCMHCEEPTCLEVCPTTATYQRADGVVGVDEERCIGCGYCIVACPYQVRKIYSWGLDQHQEGSAEVHDRENRKGVCLKCSFCNLRLDLALQNGLKPGEDQAVTPACVNTCTAGALSFGDLDDPESHVSKLLRDNQIACLQDSLGTRPRIYYIVPDWFGGVTGMAGWRGPDES